MPSEGLCTTANNLAVLSETPNAGCSWQSFSKDITVIKTGRRLLKKNIANFNLDRHVVSDAGSGEL